MAAYRKQRLALVSRFESSGLTADQFSKQNNLPLHQFYYWIKVIRDKKEDAGQIPGNNFIPVKVVKQNNISTPVVELVCPNGIKLTFYSPVNFSELRALIG